jgi:hypothetical protein
MYVLGGVGLQAGGCGRNWRLHRRPKVGRHCGQLGWPVIIVFLPVVVAISLFVFCCVYWRRRGLRYRHVHVC